VSESRIIVTPLGVEPAGGTPSAARNGFLFVGSLIPRKDVATLLRAWKKAAVASPLGVVGDGPERGVLGSIATQLGVEVGFHGAQPPAQALAHMEDAECLVLPSISEGRPVVIMEMLARGGDVLASRIPGVVELLGSGWPGLFDPGDVDELACLIGRYCADPDFRREMKEAAEGVVRYLTTDLEGSTVGFVAAYREAERLVR
jgi:glycosyltransferase involved in cell wall biosynthesis